MLQASAALLPAATERCSFCPHVSPAVVPRGCWALGAVCVQAGSEPLCQVMGRDPETHGTQHGDTPRNREAQAWPVLLWNHGAHSLCEPSVLLAALVLMPG